MEAREQIERAKSYMRDAVLAQDTQVINDLLQAGFPVDELIDRLGTTLLMIAVINDKIEVAKLLSQFSPNPNTQDSVGRTALHFACKSGNLRMV